MHVLKNHIFLRKRLILCFDWVVLVKTGPHLPNTEQSCVVSHSCSGILFVIVCVGDSLPRYTPDHLCSTTAR